MEFLSEVSEGLYAGVVRALILAAQSIHPAVKEWWETSDWSKAVVAGACLLTAAIMWVITCPLKWLDIPIYQPGCDPQGFILDVLYKGFLAYMLNWGGESAFKWAKDKAKNRVCKLALGWLGSFWFWVFIITVAVELLLTQMTLGWQVSLAISIGVAILSTLLGVALFPSIRSLRIRILSKYGNMLWWAAIVAKIVVHLLPLPFWLKPIINLALTAVVFVLANFVFGRRI